MLIAQLSDSQSRLYDSHDTNRTHYNSFFMNKFEIEMRIMVLDPSDNVAIKVQKGRDELLAPASANKKALVFDFPITVDLSDGNPNFLGKFVQGPRHARFVYVNSGTYAGQADSCWGRRAKIPLTGISAEQIQELRRSPGGKLEVSFAATGGRDGGPVCGTIRFQDGGWKIIKE